jgi:hypothetical protein
MVRRAHSPSRTTRLVRLIPPFFLGIDDLVLLGGTLGPRFCHFIP